MLKIIKFIIKAIPGFIQLIFFNLTHSNVNKHSKVYIFNKLSKISMRLMKACNINYVITGKENLPVEQSYLIVPNHQGMLDATTMMAIMDQGTPISFVCKKEVKKMPLIGPINKELNSIFMDRGNLKAELKDMLKVRKSLQNDDAKWIIFPEGTRTRDTINYTMNEFKPGTFKFPMSINKKIVPCAMYGTHNVLDKKNKSKSYNIYVHFFEPITPEFYKDKTTQEVASFAQNLIQNKVYELKKYDDSLAKKGSVESNGVSWGR